jgi:hypothetical protein
MANQIIDPAFQAAPYLGDSSHDPIEFVRRQNTVKYQRNKQKQDEMQSDINKGLDKLTLDLKDLYAEKGINEVLGDQAKAKEAFVQLRKKGVNVFSPTTALDIKAFQAINKIQEETMRKTDVITANKTILDSYSKALLADQKLPKDQQVFDHVATKAKIEEAKKAKGSVLENQGLFDDLLVKNVTPVDVIKDITANKDFFEKPTVTQTWALNPETGQNESTSVEKLTPDQVKSNAQKAGTLYESKPPAYKDAVRKLKDAETDPIFKVMDDKEYYKTLAVPPYKEKYIEKVQNKGTGFDFKFLGASGKLTPGEHQTNQLVYGGNNFNNRYDFSFPTAKSFFIPPAGGEYSTENEWKPITDAGGPLEGNLQFYDANSDALVFKLSQDARHPWIKNNTTIAVPRKNLAKADDLPVKLANGKTGTLKDILPKEVLDDKKQLPLPNNFWSKPTKPYIPKTK